MGMWSEKVFPVIHKFFWKDDANKAAAEQACKSFDESKDEISKEFEEKKGVMKPKVVEIYEASSTEIKSLIKEPKESDLKKHSEKVKKFLDKLVKIDFPGSKAAYEVSAKYGLTLASGPAIFIFEKVSIFIVTQEEPKVTVKTTTNEPPVAATTTTVSREIDINEVKAPPPKQEATKAKATTTDPPSTTVNKDVATKEAKAQPQPQAITDKAITNEPPVVVVAATTSTTTTVNKEVVVEKAVAKEPQKGTTPPDTGKETPKVDVKKDEPLKKA